jgi:cell wall-associated NlpC family hydrolase
MPQPAAVPPAAAVAAQTPVVPQAQQPGAAEQIVDLAAPHAGGAANGKVRAMTAMANSLLGKPYILGGGHSGWAPQAGYDCSGFVSRVLHAGGYLSAPVDTTALPSQPGILSGPGKLVTIYDRAQPGENGHVIIDINGQFYESGGMHGPWGGGGGVEKIGRPSASYLATFESVLHPDGL